MRDSLYDDVAVRIALTVARYDSEGELAGSVIDTVGDGQFFRALMFIFNAGAIDDGTYSLGLLHSDDEFDDWGSVSAEEIQGHVGGYDLGPADARSIRRIGYLGGKRYVRLTVTASDVTEGGDFGATALLSSGTRAVT